MTSRIASQLAFLVASLLVMPQLGAAPPKAARAVLEPPDVLARYYEQALTVDGEPSRLISRADRDGAERLSYAGARGTVKLIVQRTHCDSASCNAAYDQVIRQYNDNLRSLHGRFVAVSATEFVAEWKSGSRRHRVFAAQLPRSLLVWERDVPATRSPDDDRLFLEHLTAATNAERFDEAMGLDVVELGRWAGPIHQHARDLLSRGDTEEALAVLKQVTTWSPYSFEAQLDLAEHARDAQTVQAAAAVVWDNAESIELTRRSADILRRIEPEWQSLPTLGLTSRGLQVVLVVLPPCNVRLVEQAGEVLSQIIEAPVRVVRLHEEWAWGVPERAFRQRDVQTALIRKAGRQIDFAGWTPDRYARELRSAFAKDDALTRFRVESFLRDFVSKPGQYQADSYVLKLQDSARRWANGDNRTLVVGVTEADIYSGQANYYFSRGIRGRDVSVSILSYARMRSTMTNEPYESRRRLVERMAKELVPASLSQLAIPRPADPADPYSYSDSVERLAQKTLVLSPATRAALDRFRSP